MINFINFHHVELFYYVARFGGFSAAARKMPYSVGQPALSSQIRKLEAHFGSLIERDPFRLSPTGQELYAAVSTCFERMDAIARKAQSARHQRIRLSASPLVVREFFRPIVRRVGEKFPELEFVLIEGQQPEIEAWLAAREVDLAVTVLDGQLPKGCRSVPLIRLPIVLLVSQDAPIHSVRDLCGGGVLPYALISPPAQDSITRSFLCSKAGKKARWKKRLTVNSIELVEAYVGDGRGVGVSVSVPGRACPPGLRVLPLPGLRPLRIGAVWPSARNEVTDALLVEFRKQAEKMKAH